MQQERIDHEQHDHRERRARAGSSGPADERRAERDHRERRSRAAPTARSGSSSRTATRSRPRQPCAGRARRRRSSGPKSASVNATFATRDREQVREARRRGTPRRRRRERARVAEQEPGEQRARRRRQAAPCRAARRRAAGWRRRQRRARDASASTSVRFEPADRVAPARAIVEARRVQRTEPAGEHDAVAGFEHAQAQRVVAGRDREQGAVRHRSTGTRTNASVANGRSRDRRRARR